MTELIWKEHESWMLVWAVPVNGNRYWTVLKIMKKAFDRTLRFWPKHFFIDLHTPGFMWKTI